MKDVGPLIMLPSIAPTSRHFSINIACWAFDKDRQSQAKSSQVSVSPFSPSASVNLLTKWLRISALPMLHADSYKPTEKNDGFGRSMNTSPPRESFYLPRKPPSPAR